MIDSGKKASTVNSYVAALKTVLKEDKVEIAEDRFLLNSLVRACKLRDNRVTIRLPIQKPLLHVLLKKIDDNFLDGENPQIYLATMYKAMLSVAYYGLLRIGEVAKGDHPVLARDVQIGDNKRKLLFILRSSKTHCQSDIPQSVKISSTKVPNAQDVVDATNPDANKFCPYQLVDDYLSMRPTYARDDEPFFVFRDRTPVGTVIIAKLLKDALTDGGY